MLHENWPVEHSGARARPQYRKLSIPEKGRCSKVEVACTAAHAAHVLDELVDDCKATDTNNDRDGCIIGTDGEFGPQLCGHPEQFVVWFQVASSYMVLMLFLPLIAQNPQVPD